MVCMEERRYYVRFKALGLDVNDEKEVALYSERLTSFLELDSRLSLLETAYNDKIKERVDIAVNVFPFVSGVAELTVFHSIKFKLLKKEVRYQKISLCATAFTQNGDSCLYFYDTQDFDEVRGIFERFVNGAVAPDFAKWKRVDIT